MVRLIDIDYAEQRWKEINEKNVYKNEYSLGDVLLLTTHEKVLEKNGWCRSDIEKLSPNYYNPNK